MSAAHTPGPWFYRRSDEWSHSVVTHHGELPDGTPNCWEVASINKRREPDHEANACLIAAAPELRAMVGKLMRIIEEYVPDLEDVGDYQMAVALLAKIDGGAA